MDIREEMPNHLMAVENPIQEYYVSCYCVFFLSFMG